MHYHSLFAHGMTGILCGDDLQTVIYKGVDSSIHLSLSTYWRNTKTRIYEIYENVGHRKRHAIRDRL